MVGVDVVAVAQWLGFMGLAHGASLLLLRRRSWFASKDTADQSTIAQAVVNVGLTGTLCILYAHSVLSTLGVSGAMDDARAADRMYGSPQAYAPTMRINLAMVLYETVFYVKYGKSLDLWIHHILGVFILVITLRTEQCGAYLAWAGTAEGTTVFLGVRTFLMQAGMQASPLYVVNGVLLWLSFLLLRVVSLFVCSWRLMVDMYHGIQPPSDITERYEAFHTLMLLSCLFIWALSTWWFWKITVGLLRALGLLKSPMPPSKQS